MSVTEELGKVHPYNVKLRICKKKKKRTSKVLGYAQNNLQYIVTWKKTTYEDHVELYRLRKKGGVENMHIHVFAYMCEKNLWVT